MKKLLSLLLVVSLVVCAVPASFAAFIDVEAGGNYAEAINTLSDLGIIKGYEDGSFKPENGVTRAEFAALITRVLGLGGIDGVAISPFIDVAADHWAVNNIKIAYDLGIIAGFGDGIFKPDDKVTYEQAVKMIVAAIGFTDMANSRGGYPGGYISVAAEKGILDNASVEKNSDPAVRGIIAQLLFNSLEVPIAEKRGEDFELTSKTLLKDRLFLTRVEGIVDGTEATKLTTPVTGLRSTEISINGTTYNFGKFTDAPDMLGLSVVAYYEVNSAGSKVLLSLNAQNDKNDSLEISGADITGISGAKVYYIDEEIDKEESQEVTIPATASIIYNSKQISFADFISNNLLSSVAEMELIDNNSDSTYDVAILKGYLTYVIKTISDKTIYDEYGKDPLVIPSSSANVLVTITKNGNSATVNNLTKGDVLSVAKSFNQTGSSVLQIVAVSTPVSGKISETYDNGDTVVITGKKYGIDKMYKDYMARTNTTSNVALGTSGTFYLNNFGEIAWISASAAATAKYGYLINAETDSQLTADIIQLQVFDGSRTKIYTGARKMKIDNTTGVTASEAITKLTASALLTNKDRNETGVVLNPYSQLIRFTTNSAGEIDYIDTCVTENGEGENVLTPSIYSEYNSSGIQYTSATKTFGGKITINSSTKVFYVPSDRGNVNAFTTKSYSSFINNTNYKIEAFDLSTTNVAKVLILYGTNQDAVINVTSPMVIIKKISDTTNNGHASKKIECVSMGGAETVYYTEGATIPGSHDYKAGDVIRFTTNSLGEIADLVALELDITTPAPNSTIGTDVLTPRRFKEINNNNAEHTTNRGNNISAYYRTVYGAAYAVGYEDQTIRLSYNLPSQNEDIEDTIAHNLISANSGTKFVIYDGSVANPDNRIRVLSAEAGLAEIKPYTDVAAAASEIFVYMRSGSLNMVYIIKK